MKYKTVVIDPPWSIDFDASKRYQHLKEKRSTKPIKDHFTHLDAIYKLEKTEDIFDFPINDFADEECLMFLWVTCGKIKGKPVIETGFELLKHWGFTYHTIFTWIKPNNLCVFSPFLSQTEHVLVAWRGNLVTLTNKQNAKMKNFLYETGYQIKHSQKPAKFYQLLRSWTPKPRIDIFARRAHEGFDGWGNEYVGNSDEGTLLEWI